MHNYYCAMSCRNVEQSCSYVLCENRPLNLKGLEREPLNCKGDEKVTFTRPFLILDKVTFDEHVNVLESYCKSDISYTFTKP